MRRKPPITSVFKLGILLAMIAAPFTLDAQVIRIRVINLHDGHPLPQQHVSVALGYRKGQKAPPKYDANLRLDTDGNGETHFSLPEPPPGILIAKVQLTSELWHCICLAIEDVQDVIQKGFVQPASNDSTGSDKKAKPEPGVILFFARPFTFFERLLYPILKE